MLIDIIVAMVLIFFYESATMRDIRRGRLISYENSYHEDISYDVDE